MTSNVSLSGARAAELNQPRTPAQWYCLVVGLALLAAGALGFLVNGSFEGASFGLDLNDGEIVNGDLFLGLEVNGWHNVVHIASGVLLLVGAATRSLAKTVAIAFAVVYAIVTVIGFVDGDDVLGFMPVNAADNILHTAIAALGLVAALVSPSEPSPDAVER